MLILQQDKNRVQGMIGYGCPASWFTEKTLFTKFLSPDQLTKNMTYLSSRSWRCDLLVVGLVLVCLPFLVSGSQVRDLTANDLSNIGKATSKNFLVVFFEKPGN